MLLDFLKDKFDKKPRIMQTLVTNDMLGEFSVDMRGLTYADNSTAAPIINTLTVTGQPTTFPALTSTWDMAVDAQQSATTAGMFTYTTGSSRGGSYGAYNYVGGNYSVYAVDWWQYFDKNDSSNVWTHPANQPN